MAMDCSADVPQGSETQIIAPIHGKSVFRKSRTSVIDKEKTVDMSHYWKTGKPTALPAVAHSPLCVEIRSRVLSPSFSWKRSLPVAGEILRLHSACK
jgi:hypothetical protein